jgi:tetratricopeptide (TPR) repeat protein
MTQLLKGVAAVVLGAVVLCGCGRKDAEVPEGAGVAEVSRAETLRSELDALKLKNGSDAVIVQMRALLKSPEEGDVKADVTSWLLDEYLTEGTLSDAQDAYLILAAEDADVARMGFRKISSASVSTNTADTVVWYEKILAAPVEDEMKAFVWKSRISLYGDAGSITPVVERLDEILAFENAELSRSVCQGIVGVAWGLKDYEGIAALLKATREQNAEDSVWEQFALTIEADVLYDKGQLVELDAFLLKHAALLGDSALCRRSEKLLVAAAKQGADAIVTRVVQSALADGAEFPQTLARIGQQWVQMAVSAKDSSAFLDRTEQILKTDFPVSRLVSLLHDGYYAVMQTRNAALQSRASAIVDSVCSKEGLSDSVKQSLGLMLLDGAFYVKDFRRALEILELGIAGHDEAWHIEIKDKVGAHLALEEGRHEDAISLFRKHISRIEKWDAPVINPANQNKMIKEAVLGFNEKRIGDIYAEMGSRAADSQAAYARAREWYQKALTELEPDSPEHKVATAELAEVPAAAATK